jgi:hypothetical protein
MSPEELVHVVVVDGTASPDDHRTLADLGLDSLDVIEVVLLLEGACPGITIGDDPVVVELTPARLRSLVGAYRNLGAAGMAMTVELPDADRSGG